jgi:hypothetical protein
LPVLDFIIVVDATIRAVRLYRQADQLMVALFGEPTAEGDGWLENRPAEMVFAASAEELPLERKLPIEDVRARIPLLPVEGMPLAEFPLADVLRLSQQLAAALPDAALASLAEQCLDQQRPDLALPLLDALPEAPGHRLAAARCRLALGQLPLAMQALELLAADPALPSDPALAAETLDCYGWALLQGGRTEPLAELIERLRFLAGSLPEWIEPVDRLARVLSTISWLEETPTDAIGCSRDLRSTDGPILALDGVQMSRCGSITLLNGWLIDPSESIESLVLLRGKRARRLSLTDGQRRQRGDLETMLAEMGLPAESRVGFQLWAINGVEEAEVPAEGEMACLFVITRTGHQCCLAQPIEAVEFKDAALEILPAGWAERQ